MPARWAPSTFSLMPPTGSTLPRRVISPVIATSWRTGRPVSSEVSAVAMVTPADGPSFGHGAGGHVDVDVHVLEEVGRDAEARRRASGCG